MFMKLMNRVFKECLDTFVIVFVEDILIYSKTDQEQKALTIWRENKLYAKFFKCEFWLRKVLFLEYEVSKDEILVDPTKIEAITKWEHATAAIEVRSFFKLIQEAGLYVVMRTLRVCQVELQRLSTIVAQYARNPTKN